MTKEELKALFNANGMREATKETYPNTFTVEPVARLLTDQFNNRDSASWKKAEYIVLDSVVEDRARIIDNWKILTSRDTLPGGIQKLCIPVVGDQYDVYNAAGVVIYNGELKTFLERGIPSNWEQLVLYGAPGTGKSYAVDCKINSSVFLEKEFYAYLKSDPALNDSSVSDYRSYYRDFQATTGRSFFDYTSPLVLSNWKIEFQNVWDSHWTPVLNKYIEFLDKRLFRTTFHPDYDYAQFVGAYKPQGTAGAIAYNFVPQVFAKAYTIAWQLFFKAKRKQTNPVYVYLVIEEINRGNCAQIFGDIFQLLDRDENGFSRYTINADYDFSAYIQRELSSVDVQLNPQENAWVDYEHQVGGSKLRLPPNLSILATMNTSDQSLFPMDSAFKRRFDWEYVSIDYAHAYADFDIEVGEKKYKWLKFLEAVNANVYKVTRSEDKQMGEVFIKHSVDYKEFRSKVLFYLWDSVYKDEEGNKDAEKVFHFKLEGNQDETLTFQTLFEGSEVDQKDRIAKIMSNLDVVDQNAPRPQQGERGANDPPAEPAPAEEPNPAQ